jgi:hypothetical protein
MCGGHLESCHICQKLKIVNPRLTFKIDMKIPWSKLELDHKCLTKQCVVVILDLRNIVKIEEKKAES